MRNKILPLLFIVLLISCRDSDFLNLDTLDPNFDVNSAKNAYEVSIKQLAEKGRYSSEIKDLVLWESHRIGKFKDGREVLIAPIYITDRNLPLRRYSDFENNDKNDLESLINSAYIVVYKDKNNNYIVEKLFIKNFDKSKPGNKFTGFHSYEDLGGKLKRGFLYKDGKLERYYDNNLNKFKTTDCQSGVIIVTYYTSGCYDGDCTPFRVTHVDYFYYNVCNDGGPAEVQGLPLDDPGGGGGGNGGGVIYAATPLNYEIINDICSGYYRMWDRQATEGKEILGFLTTAGKLIIPPSFENTSNSAVVSNYYSGTYNNRSMQFYSDASGTHVQLNNPNVVISTTGYPVNYYETYDVVGIVHSHPVNGLSSPSPADISLANSYSGLNHYILTGESLIQYNSSGNILNIAARSSICP